MNNQTEKILNLVYAHLNKYTLGISKKDLMDLAYPDGHENVDSAIPLNWGREVEKLYPNFYRDVVPYLVWSYREEDGNRHGTPVNLISKIIERYRNDEVAAQELISLWEKL